MRKIFLLFTAAIIIATSCQDDDHELGRALDPSEIDYEVIQDYSIDQGGNTVILKNNTPGTISMWDYGTGRSNRAQDTVRFAFQGEYVIQFSALTAGGVVEMEPVTIQVTEDNLNYVNDPLWTLLTGGVGNSKTWILDGFEDGLSKYYTSPLYFAGEENVNSEFDGTSLVWTKECSIPGGPDPVCFAYEPNWKSDTWVGPWGNYGSMTFSLQGGPFFEANHNMIPERGEESGTFFLDVNGLRITFTDATPLHIPWVPNNAVSMYDVRLISLSEEFMQLGIKDKAKTEYLILNYISEEFNDNWVPEGPEEDPNFDHGDQQQIISVSTSPTKTWKLDLEVPYNWTNLQGEFLNDWESRQDIVNTGWAPYGDADVENIDDASITFSTDGTVVVQQDDGSTQEGSYVIDEASNMITFTDIDVAIPIAGWVTAAPTGDRQWKIVRVERSPVNDAVTGIWLGQRAADKDEYMVFHFVIR